MSVLLAVAMCLSLSAPAVAVTMVDVSTYTVEVRSAKNPEATETYYVAFENGILLT